MAVSIIIALYKIKLNPVDLNLKDLFVATMLPNAIY